MSKSRHTDSPMHGEGSGGDEAAAPANMPNVAGRPGKSLLGKAKEAIHEIANQASSASRPIASKAASLSRTGVAKTAEATKKAYTTASEVTRDAVRAGTQAYTGSKLESAIQYIDGELDQRGAKQAAKETTRAIVGKLDQVTGKQLVEMLEKRLQVQDTYNDILATRLAEALDRIAALEAKVADLGSQ